MRITCDVDVSNRLLPSLSLKGKQRTARSQLSIGHKPGADPSDSDVYLMVCTKLDRNGAKYKLKANIEQVFTKFINEGKATIRFKDPPHDLRLSKGDVVQLKSFLQVVKLGYEGKGLDKVTLSSLAPANASQVDKLKTKLSITSKKDYPITTNFPRSLEVLQVTGCNLKKVDSRIVQQLGHLRMLDLSHNCIQNVPECWDTLPHLAELRLAHNLIEYLPRGMCSGSLTHSLSLLDLSNNKLTGLGPFFSNLTLLATLKLDSNQLQSLPQRIGDLQRLCVLSATSNKLVSLPGSFIQLNRLDQLDLYGNPFDDSRCSIPTEQQSVGLPSLLEWSARAVCHHRLPYTGEDVGAFLYDLLQRPKVCLCGGVCFQFHIHYLSKFDLRNLAHSVVGVDKLGCSTVPTEGYLCSQRCADKFRKNPHAATL